MLWKWFIVVVLQAVCIHFAVQLHFLTSQELGDLRHETEFGRFICRVVFPIYVALVPSFVVRLCSRYVVRF